MESGLFFRLIFYCLFHKRFDASCRCFRASYYCICSFDPHGGRPENPSGPFWAASGLNGVRMQSQCVGGGGGRGALCCCHDTRCRIIGRPIRKLNCTFQAETAAPVCLPCCLDMMNNHPARLRLHLWRSAASSQTGLRTFTASFSSFPFPVASKYF